MVGDTPFVVGFAPFEAIADRDGSGFRGVDAESFPAGRVELDDAAVLGAEGEGIVVNGGDRKICALRNRLRLLPRLK